MAGRSELLDHLVDQLALLGDARGRPMRCRSSGRSPASTGWR